MLVVLVSAGLATGLGRAADAPAPAILQDQVERANVLARASQAVVCIFAESSLAGGGSGVLISPLGYGLTNFHVVQEMLATRRGFGGLNDGRLYPLKVLGLDPAGDTALFRLQGREVFPFAPLGDSDELEIGEAVAAIGNPFLVAEDFTPTITYGIISGLRRYQPGQNNLLEYADCIQVSSSINPGNSGGPLFDRFGRVIGINGRGSFEERGRVNVGLGYAISINQIKRFLPTLLAGRLCEHAALGATVRELDDKLIFDAVQDLAPAAKAGIEPGDELVRFAGRRMRTSNDFVNLLTTLPADWPVSFTVRHGSAERAAAARTERAPLPQAGIYEPDPEENSALAQRLSRGVRAVFGLESAPKAGAEHPDWRVRLRFDQADMDAKLVFTTDGLRVVPAEAPAGAPAAPDAAASGPASAPVAPLQLASQLLAILDPRAVLGRVVLGGAEHDGRIEVVVEQPAVDGAAIRWYCDLFTGDLRRIRLGDSGQSGFREWVVRREAQAIAGTLGWRLECEDQQARGLTALQLDAAPQVATDTSFIPEPQKRGIGPSDDLRIGGAFGPAIAAAQARVVKLYGRGIGRATAYGSGVIISTAGEIVTGLSSLLESPTLRVALPDGRRAIAKVVARDEQRQLALLKCDVKCEAAFELTSSADLKPGDWLVAASNTFKVAEGPEAVSVSAGIFSGRVTLAARRRQQEFVYDGLVLLTDVIVSTPGAEGGALVDSTGRLVGLLGKAVTSKRTNTWISYALPVEEVAAFVQAARQPGGLVTATRPVTPTLIPASRPVDIGIRLFDLGGTSMPPYVERVRPGSLASAAGLAVNDLLLTVAGEHVATCAEARTALERLQLGRTVELSIKRNNEVVLLQLSTAGATP